MSSLSRSYLKVPYDLRTAKQIERRMIVDALHRLTKGTFDIKNYQYTGMGSIYFVDFILFHRLLGMSDLLSVEYSDEIKKRVKFNRPFNCVRLEFGPIGDIIPTLSPRKKHILWLDYDNLIDRDIVIDAVNAATQLTSGSILLVTVDVEPPVRDGRQKDWRRYYMDNLGSYCSPSWTIKEFAQSNLINVNVKILESAILQGIAGRNDCAFMPLFKFSYADGHEMLTLGGMIGGQDEQQKLRKCNFRDADYIRQDLARPSYRVPVVRVTRKERLYLDSAMPPKKRKWIPTDFEFDRRSTMYYKQIYRYLPSYAELLL